MDRSFKTAEGSNPNIVAGETANVLTVRAPRGTSIRIVALYVNWKDNYRNELLRDGEIIQGGFYYDIGNPSQLEPLRPPIECQETFIVRTTNEGVLDIEGEAVCRYVTLPNPYARPPPSVRTKVRKGLRGRFIR